MKVFTCTDHAGHWPVGVASVVVAVDEGDARQLLDAELLEHGLDTTPYTLNEVATDKRHAVVLLDGEY